MLKCRAALKEAALRGAELAVFPEMALTGFSFDERLADSDGLTLRFFSECSRECSVSCAFGYSVSEGGRLYNRLSVTSADGALLGSYDKIHPFSFSGEDKVFTAGERAVTVNIGEVCFGLAVCYDLRFPELFGRLSQQAECLIVSANWPKSRRAHWQTLLKARAIETQSYVIGCNCCGERNGLEYSGDSAVIAPDGSVLAQAQAGAEQLIFADISRESVSRLRREFPVRNDRKNHLYRNFYE